SGIRFDMAYPRDWIRRIDLLSFVVFDDALSKEKGIDKLMALISPSFKKTHKPTNNNLRISSNTSRANQDNTPRINRGSGYDNQRAIDVVRAGENVAAEAKLRYYFMNQQS
ncbi:hypothetical protein Tco_1513190, partial [Tanacetum coccineum]